MSKIKNIIIHCSQSSFGDAMWIKNIHINENGWRDIGYNGVILNGAREKGNYNTNNIGRFEMGRGLDLNETIDSNERGAHALGYNEESLGLCLIGDKKFYIKQFQTALYFCALFMAIIPDIKIFGHYELNENKTCPNFDMKQFRGLLKNRDFIDDEIKMVMEKYL